MRVAIAIPTYNSCYCLNELLEKEYDILSSFGCDFFIYDSSDNDKTEKMICSKWNRQNVHFKKYNSSIESNVKVFNIFLDFRGNTEYDFLWFRRDAHFFDYNYLTKIFGSLRTELDFLLINTFDNEFEGRLSGTKALFRQYSYYLTLYGAGVISLRCISSAVCWDDFGEKIVHSKCINFSHVSLYFELLSKISNPKIEVCCVKMNGSKHKGDSFWEKDIFRIWTESWGMAISETGNRCGFEKEDSDAALHSVFMRFSSLNLIWYRMKGLFSMEICEKYGEWLSRIYDINIECQKRIGKLSPEEAREELDLTVREKLSGLYEKCNRIMIYGAGKYSTRNYEYVLRNGLDIEAFVVSKSKQPNERFMEHDVIVYDAIRQCDDVGFIVSMGKRAREEVIKMLIEDGHGEHFIEFDYPLK